MKPPITIELPTNYLKDPENKLQPIAGGLRFVHTETGDEYELYKVNRNPDGSLASLTIVPLSAAEAREEEGVLQ